MNRRQILAGTAAAMIADSARPHAQSQPFPSRPVRIVVPYPPGGPNDIVARALARVMAETFRQPVVVDNRPGGAGGIVGTEHVARSAPDGYTLVLNGITHAIAPAVYPRLPFDAVADFTPVSMVGWAPLILVVHPSVQATSIAELIALARREPGRLSYASTGVGTSIHLAGEQFNRMAGVDIVHVPYRGSAPAMVALISGEVQMMIEAMPSALPAVRNGQLRLLAVTSPQRLPQMPDLPTVAESGLPGFDAGIWWGLLGPARMPPDVTNVLNDAANAALRDAEVRASFDRLGIQPLGTTPEAFASRLREDVARFERIAREVNIRVEN